MAIPPDMFDHDAAVAELLGTLEEPKQTAPKQSALVQDVDEDGYIHGTFTYVAPKFPNEKLDLLCGDCGAFMRLRTSEYGAFYGCTRYPECNGKHGAKPDGAPLGTPADAATRLARKRAHDLFDQLWKRPNGMSRSDAYTWMQVTLGLLDDEAHIAKFDLATCEKLMRQVIRKLNEKKPSFWSRLMGRDPF